MLSPCNLLLITFLLWITICNSWLPDSTSKIINNKLIDGITFTVNTTYSQHFNVLHQDKISILLGGRNCVYNLSTNDFREREENRIDWPSPDALGQLCILKGKTEDDCQNYIRILYKPEPEKIVLCGTNSYKPMCKFFFYNNKTYVGQKEFNGVGLCPGNPEHNSTSIFHNNQLYSGTVADLSESDPLIYREPQRTEFSDLKQLNAPNFVKSMAFGEYILFFYRETAVEYMNCGKVVYSRVARVCKNDKGGPHQSRDRWTSYLKARLNCSIPGEYPFYFDEIQSTTDIIQGVYNSNLKTKIVYGIFTTPTNSIGGSAICAYQMEDILRVFSGKFKHQENINSNWLPVPDNMVPEPRPGKCVVDSRILPDKNFNFIKTHSLMEGAVPAMFSKPILVRVSLHYRFSAIAVDPQIKCTNNKYFDVIYIGTNDGRVLKIVNIPYKETAKTVVISENTVLSHGAAVKELRIVPENGRIVVVGKNEARQVNLKHCKLKRSCSECIQLQDPHCAWDIKQNKCVNVDSVAPYQFLIQDIFSGDAKKCLQQNIDNKESDTNVLEDNVMENKVVGKFVEEDDITYFDANSNSIDTKTDTEIVCSIETDMTSKGCTANEQLVIYTAGTLHIVVVIVSLVGLVLGFLGGYWFSKRYHSPYPGAPFIEQHNHLDRMSTNTTGYLTPRWNKSVNLMVNVASNTPSPKKDNLDVQKDVNISNDGTLKKIKKTYI